MGLVTSMPLSGAITFNLGYTKYVPLLRLKLSNLILNLTTPSSRNTRFFHEKFAKLSARRSETARRSC